MDPISNTLENAQQYRRKRLGASDCSRLSDTPVTDAAKHAYLTEPRIERVPGPLNGWDLAREMEHELHEAHQLLRVLADNMLDDGPTWPRVLEWLARNEAFRP